MTGLLAAALALSGPASGAYQAVQDKGAWSFKAPDGSLFLANGVCCVNRGLKKDEITPENPGYSSLQLFKTDAEWAASAAAELKRSGFNTIGAWSDHSILASSGLCQTPVLHLSAAGIPWVDPWDPKAQEAAREVARSQIAEWRKIPGVIGYFSDNELGWWHGALFEWTWKGAPGTPGRRKAAAFFKSRYGSWAGLVKDFDPEGAASFDELAEKGRLYLRPGGRGQQNVQDWLSQVADQYYSLCRSIIKEQHPGALFLGDRYISGYYPGVVRAAGRHVDVLSTNLNADWPQGEFAPFYLDGLRTLARRPILVTEYYAAAMENQSGNMNDASGFPTLDTQKQRVASFRRQTEFLLSQPDIVGVHWFQFYDEPRHGRGDGENYNFGLVDIFGKPYKALEKAALDVFSKPRIRKAGPLVQGKAMPYVSPSQGRDFAGWPHWQAAMPRTSGEPRGDLYLAWNESGLYGCFYWSEDRFFEAYYRDGKVPQEDEAQFSFKVDGGPEVKGRLLPGGPELDGASLIGWSGGVRSWTAFRIHASQFKKARLEAGQAVPFQASLSTRGGAYRLEWKAAPAAARIKS